MEKYNELRFNLIRLRNSNNMTQKDFAVLLDVDDSTYRGWENGRCMMPVRHLKTIADRFKIDNLYQFLFDEY